MRLAVPTLLAALVPGLVLAGASGPLKAVIVSYPDDTPQSVMQQAMDAIVQAKGVITHEYQIIKGFAAKATEEALNQVRVQGANDGVRVEDDQVVSINGRS